jgi:hypothetical protein
LLELEATLLASSLIPFYDDELSSPLTPGLLWLLPEELLAEEPLEPLLDTEDPSLSSELLYDDVSSLYV